MKKLIAVLACALSVSAFGATEKAQREIEEAMSGDYQKLRNVAFAMRDGTFGHDKNPISACALRKVILLIHPDKADVGDYANEYHDCGKLSMQDSMEAWNVALQSIPIILKYKK
ncbi:hypothetical protein BMT54_01275 [Pasteurellaceae bacterium 15-036681]|nr:hypothetical protein BMT54_01275 [Pasteurellaceae bacterium 15-036681]